MVFSEKLPVLDEPRLNVLIIHELGEDEKLLAQKLECEVHLKKMMRIERMIMITGKQIYIDMLYIIKQSS